jgi:hypothetical protein
VDLRRRARADREHRAPGAGQDPRRPSGPEGHFAVHRAQGAGRLGRLARRAQRRGPRRTQPQDGLSRHGEHRAQLRRGPSPARRRGGRGGLSGRRAAPRAELHVPHDERGAAGGRARRDRARLHRLPSNRSTMPAPGCRVGPRARKTRTPRKFR